MDAEDPQLTLERTFREDRAAVLAVLAARLRDLGPAEDAVADAFAEAARTWPRDGAPDAPRAWLTTVAWRRALDRHRRAAAEQRRVDAAAVELLRAGGAPAAGGDADLLGLVAGCCHPALSLEARIALTLRCVLGLTTEEVAAATLVPTATAAQRIVRAKRKLRDAGASLAPPPLDRLDDRLDAVHHVVVALVTSGATAPVGERVGRPELLTEAVWLARLVHRLAPRDRGAAGVLALALATAARSATRSDARGRALLLDEQDRSRWDHDLVAEAADVLAGSTAGPPTRWWLEGAVAVEHARAPSVETTDWATVAGLLHALERRTGLPTYRVERALAVAQAGDAVAGLALLDEVDREALAAWPSLPAVEAELLERVGRTDEARVAWREALDRTTQPALRARLRERLADA